MSDLDEGRDLRAAFGTLLADEPASPWSASDDVARGRALQRRRRTRAGAGIGLVAAVVMVFGVFGPLRPQPTVVVPPAYQPPAVQGVDAEWLAALDRSFTAFNGPVVDWSRSTVTPTAGGGFSLDLTLVGATVTTGGEDFTIEYAEPPGPAVARAFVTWKPGGGEGPVLASCAAPACVRADRGVSPGFAEDGGRWDADAAQLAGTFVVDRTYDDGAVLELASAPYPDTEGGWSPVMNYGGISFVLDRVGRPSDGAPTPTPSPTPTPTPTPTPSNADPVTRLLESYGYRVISTSPGRMQGGGVSTVYSVDVDLNADNPVNASLTVTRVPAGVEVGSERVALSGVAMNSCDERTCTPVTSVYYPCPSSSCFQDWWAITTPAYTGLDQGTLLVFRSNGSQAVELVVGVPSCATCGTGPTGKAFLSLEDAQQVLNAIGLSDGAPTPSGAASCTNDQVKLVPAVDSTGGATGERSVAIEVYARNPSVSCTVRADPAAKLLVGGVPASGVTYGEGFFTPGEKPGMPVSVDGEHAAVFVIAKYRCDAGSVDRADGVDVRLPGSPTSTVVELPDSLGLELCGGEASDVGNQVSVSVFIPRDGGVG